MQRGSIGKRKASVPLTDSLERRRAKVFHHEGIPYLKVWFLLRSMLIRDRFTTILSDRTCEMNLTKREVPTVIVIIPSLPPLSLKTYYFSSQNLKDI